jgi:uncharacterized membrane protein
MTTDRRELAAKYLDQDLETLPPHDRHIIDRFITRRPVARNVGAEYEERLRLGQRVADSVAATMGSWRFIIFQSAALAVWIVLNVTVFVRNWDPYPFILLNLALSFQAAYAAPIIMMSQNRQAEKDRLQTKNDYEVDMKAELEVLQLHEKIDELRENKWASLIEIQQRQIAMLESIVAELRTGRPPKGS